MKFRLNKECKRELVATVIYNLTYVTILILLQHFKLFEVWGIKPDLIIFLWLIAGVSIIASFISVSWSYIIMFKRK